MQYAIETHELRKHFGSRTAVRNLSLNVRQGEIFGFLGPNGAGKSTSIKMLLGLVKPSGGNALVLGVPAGDVEKRRHIGFLPEDFRFYDWLTAAELLCLHGKLCAMPTDRLAFRVPEVIEMVGLSAHRDRRLRTFSKGMLQRIGLAQALIHEPQIIFLDEPTSGLDPIGRRMVRDILRAQRERGASVFLNSHILSEIEVTCDRVVFIKDGEVVADRDLNRTAQDAIRVKMRIQGVSETALAGIAQWANDAALESEHLHFSVPSENVLADVIHHLVMSGSRIFSVTPERDSLEDQFVHIVGEDRGL